MKQQINALTATRAVAAIMVVIHHFGGEVYPFSMFPKFFHSGNVAVSYFFVLSGFVLFISYSRKPVSYTHYIKRRIARIVPAYLLALSLFVCVAYCFYGFSFSAHSVNVILVSALFLQAYIPHYSITLNLPGWTISVEMFFYLLFPLLLSVLKKNPRLFIVMAIVLFLLSQAIHLWFFPARQHLSDYITDPVFFNPAIHLNQFLIGMAGGFLYKRTNATFAAYSWVSFPLFVVIVLLVVFRPESISFQVGLLTPVIMLFILSIAACNPAFLNNRMLVFLGEISYGIYILQLPVYRFFEAMDTRYWHMPPPYLFFFSFAMLLLAASISYLFFEKPLREKIISHSHKGKTNIVRV